VSRTSPVDWNYRTCLLYPAKRRGDVSHAREMERGKHCGIWYPLVHLWPLWTNTHQFSSAPHPWKTMTQPPHILYMHTPHPFKTPTYHFSTPWQPLPHTSFFNLLSFTNICISLRLCFFTFLTRSLSLCHSLSLSVSVYEHMCCSMVRVVKEQVHCYFFYETLWFSRIQACPKSRGKHRAGFATYTQVQLIY